MYNEHCRLCGNQNNEKFDIFSEICSNKKLESKIREIVRLNILPEDPLPKTVCVSCINHLENASHFVDQCHQTQTYLSQLYEESILPIPTQNSFRAPNYAEKITVVLNDRADFEINTPELRSILTPKLESDQTNSDYNSIENNSSQIVSVPLGDENTCQNSAEVPEKSSAVQDNSDPPTSNRNHDDNTNTPGKKNIIPVEKISDEILNHTPPRETCSPTNTSQETVPSTNTKNTTNNRSRLKRKCTIRTTPIINQFDSSDEENHEPDKYCDYSDDLNDKRYKNRYSSAKKPKLQTELRPFLCKLCPSTFKAVHVLNHHIQTVHSDQRIKCSICGYIVKHHTYLRKHVRKVHYKPYVCAICDYRTGDKFVIREHITQKHSPSSWTLNINKENVSNEQKNEFQADVRPFLCTLCPSSFKAAQVLNQHIRTVHSDQQIKCSICGYLVKHVTLLRKHVRKVHYKPYVCAICDYRTGDKFVIRKHITQKHSPSSWTLNTNKESVTNEQKADDGSNFSCAFCGQTFSQELTYHEHLSLHSRISVFSCKLCSSSFKKKYNLKRHIQRIHSEKQFKCSICDHVVKLKDELTQHIKTVHGKSFACDMCDYQTGLRNQLRHHIANKHAAASWTSKKNAEESDTKRFFCATCKKTFSQELTYQEHLNVHSGKRPFSCKLCTASFRARQDLNQHLRTVHSEKQFKCPTCNYVAKHKGKLTEHIKCVHDKPFACDKCAYRTGEKGKIQQHIASKHTNASSFVCEVCGNGFKTKYSLQMHMKNIHFPEPKVCQTCGTLCPSLSKYNAHIFKCGKEKQKYECDTCGQTYVSKEVLRDHMNKHLNQKPYKCKICGKAFHMRTRLWTHEYVHRGANYQCEICNRSFNRKDNMKNHMKRHFYKSMKCDDTIVTAV